MKIEIGFSLLSKTTSLLGIDIETQNGMVRDEDTLYRERVIELRIGIIFAYISICFVTKGEEMQIPDELKESLRETFENMEKQIKEHIKK